MSDRPRSKKVFFFLLLGSILLFYAYLTFTALHIPLPDSEKPILFYSNQTRHDIKLTFLEALKRAEESIHLSVYGISDPQILTLLAKKSAEDLRITLEYDPSASRKLEKILPPSIHFLKKKCKGLMHNKIIVLDEKRIFLGTANLTTTSLRHHANFVVGLKSEELAHYLVQPDSPSFHFLIGEQNATIYLLPDPKGEGLRHLIESIDRAEKTLHVAMFTFTHPQIAQALIRAKQRGVDVQAAIDYYTAKGASKKTLERMHAQGIKIYLSQGRELLHHKWALIDDHCFILGSANWTKAAFSKNADFLLFLFSLSPPQRKFIKNLWEIIENESILYPPEL